MAVRTTATETNGRETRHPATALRSRLRQNDRSATPTGREAAAPTRPARPCRAGAAPGALHAGSCSQRGAPGRRRIAGAKAEERRTSASGGRGVSSPGSHRPLPSRWQRRAGVRRPEVETRVLAFSRPSSLLGDGDRRARPRASPSSRVRMARPAGARRPAPSRLGGLRGRPCSARVLRAPALPALGSALSIGCGRALLPIRKRLSWRKGINTRWLLV